MADLQLSGIKVDDLFHDISLAEDGSFDIVVGVDKIAQDINTRLRTIQGEVILDNTYGFPFRTIFRQRVVNLIDMERQIKQYILETTGVNKITRFLLSYVGDTERLLKIDFTVDTVFDREIDIVTTTNTLTLGL